MSTTKRVIIAVVVLLVLSIAGILTREGYLLATAAPNITVDYAEQINTRVRETNQSLALPKGDYAAFEHLLRTIAEPDRQRARAAFPTDNSPQVQYAALYNPGESDEQQTLAQQAMADHVASGRIDTLEQLPGLVGAFRKIPGNSQMLSVLLPELSDARHVARLLNARFVLAAREGRQADAAIELQRIVSLGSILTRQATLIDRLVGVAIHSLAIDSIRDLHASGHMPGSLAAKLLPIAQQIGTRPTYAPQLESERACMLDVIQRTHTKQGRFIPSEFDRILGGTGFRAPLQLPVFMPRKAETEALANNFYDLAINISQQPSPARDYSQLDAATAIKSANPVFSAMIPALSKALTSEDQLLTTLHGVQTLLALEIHRDRTGAYPRTLNELVPSVFPQLPPDVIAKDGTFRYTPRPEGVTSGRPFLLYSIGRDQIDNQGTEHPTLDVTALTLSSLNAGIDYVVNRKSPSNIPADSSAPRAQ
ncbi:MAG: hypothetical protein ACK5ZG_16340 [Phycisphaerae bacterium]|jgi:hypothetical protein